MAPNCSCIKSLLQEPEPSRYHEQFCTPLPESYDYFKASLSLSLWGVIKTGILVKLLKLHSKINKSTIGNFIIWVYLSVCNILHPKFCSLKQEAVLRKSRSCLAGWVWLRISHKVAVVLWPWTAVIWRLEQGQRICSPGLPHMAAG